MDSTEKNQGSGAYDFRAILDKMGVVRECSVQSFADVSGAALMSCFTIKVFATGSTINSYEELLELKDKKKALLIEDSSGLKVVEQSIAVTDDGVVLCWRDISDVAMDLKSELEQQYREKYFSAIGKVTHDFNNVLSVVQGHSELANYIKDSEKKSKHVNQILEAVGKIRNLLRQVLVFRHHGDEKENCDFDLSELIQRPLAEVKELKLEKIKFNTHLIPGSKVFQSRQRMTEVFSNILNNAVNSIEENGVVSLKMELTSEGFYQVMISDDGIGMSESTLAEAFEPFFSTCSRMDAAGVGLSIVKGIIDEIGGRIEIQSTLGEGTCVTVYVPAAI